MRGSAITALALSLPRTQACRREQRDPRAAPRRQARRDGRLRGGYGHCSTSTDPPKISEMDANCSVSAGSNSAIVAQGAPGGQPARAGEPHSRSPASMVFSRVCGAMFATPPRRERGQSQVVQRVGEASSFPPTPRWAPRTRAGEPAQPHRAMSQPERGHGCQQEAVALHDARSMGRRGSRRPGCPSRSPAPLTTGRGHEREQSSPPGGYDVGHQRALNRSDVPRSPCRRSPNQLA